MKIGLVTIGAELLNGTRIDSNAGWIGTQVTSHGGKVIWHTTISAVSYTHLTLPTNREV